MGINPTLLLLLSFLSLLSTLTPGTSAYSRYARNFDVPAWSKNNVRSINKGHVWQLVLDNTTAPGFASKASYLFGSFDMNIKLIRGDSAGTVTAFYLASSGVFWDELDFEFLGNESGQPYLLQTNVFWNGTGGREQRINLWFDPTSAYHNYSLLWNPQQIIFAVDGIPIRAVKNNENIGIPYLNKQPLNIYASLWDGSTWATQGGLVKINWREAPFVVSFGQYKIDTCTKAKAKCMRRKWWNSPSHWTLSTYQKSQLNWVMQNYMSYNYCNDTRRYPTTPLECLQQA